jgi:diguanylate cyclase (GGDEF)-like protein
MMTSMTSDSPFAATADSGAAALSMLAKGAPIYRTLEAVAAVAARLQAGSRSAVLLLNEGRLGVEAEVDLLPSDRVLLDRLAEESGVAGLISLGRANNAEVRPLLTQTAELVGLVVVFDFSPGSAGQQAMQQLDQVCSIATLAIEQKNLCEELSYRAHYDQLTRLRNRAWMTDAIARTLETARETGQSTALIQINVDAFRLFNELLGREAGDELLRQLAARLADALEPGSTLARSSGDEFMILMPNVSSGGRAGRFARQLRSWFDQPFMVGGHELILRASFGTATSGPGECHSNELQNRAEQALLSAKTSARGSVASFSPEMVKTPPERLLMERHLRFALQKRELELYYQPQVFLPTGKLVGVEALLRWKHASLGFISPASFVPVAEEIGIIEEIGEWVLGEAIRQLEAWQTAGLGKVRLAVNVSPLQFARTDFAALVARRLRDAQVRPEDLELEITETALMTNLEHGARQLNLLRSLGVQIALDDFGTGHSSLAYLQQLPIDRLKIDRMFVKDIVRHDARPALLSSVIQMGRSIGCQVIAEGVETVEQALALSALNCNEAQGFLFSKPLPPADLFRWATSRLEVAIASQNLHGYRDFENSELLAASPVLPRV